MTLPAPLRWSWLASLSTLVGTAIFAPGCAADVTVGAHAAQSEEAVDGEPEGVSGTTDDDGDDFENEPTPGPEIAEPPRELPSEEAEPDEPEEFDVPEPEPSEPPEPPEGIEPEDDDVQFPFGDDDEGIDSSGPDNDGSGDSSSDEANAGEDNEGESEELEDAELEESEDAGVEESERNAGVEESERDAGVQDPERDAGVEQGSDDDPDASDADVN